MSNFLDDPKSEIKSLFKLFIKDKSIEQLLEQDNKIFSEIKALENEKHIMVTQNYKKFVTATETINSIKLSLNDFEKDLGALQDRVGSLVNSFNKVNTRIEPLVQKADDTYRLKKDLKRLKFINDLPNILEQAYLSYQTSEPKDINAFNKALSYYQKCKDFLLLHKDHSLVIDIYNKSQSYIYKFKTIIQDYLVIPESSDTQQLELLTSCLKLLVKIEDDKSDLIFMFVERYKLVISKRFDEFFAMNENVREIDYMTYLKIYNTFEFSINENEFPFYENQIRELEKEKDPKDEYKLSTYGNRNFEFHLLSSKFFKKGTLMWISKKIAEGILQPIIINMYNSFKELFDERYYSNLNIVYSSIVELYHHKMVLLLKDSFDRDPQMNHRHSVVDSIFLKESLTNFHGIFNENLMKIHDSKINSEHILESIHKANNDIVTLYLNQLNSSFTEGLATSIIECYEKLCNAEEDFFSDNIKQIEVRYNKVAVNKEVETLIKSLIANLVSKIGVVKTLDYTKLVKANNDSSSNQLYNTICSLFEKAIGIFNSIQLLSMQEKYQPKFETRRKIVFLGIIVLKQLNKAEIVKLIIEKVNKEITSERIKKLVKQELKTFIDIKIAENVMLLQNQLINNQAQLLFEKQKELFFAYNETTADEIICFRKEVRDLFLSFYLFKVDIYNLLEDEKRLFHKIKNGDKFFQRSSTAANKKPGQVQLMMEALLVRKLVGFEDHIDSPQALIEALCKVFLKNFLELIKLKRLNKPTNCQFQFDLFFIRQFTKEYLMYDYENLREGFFREIRDVLKANSYDQVEVDSNVIFITY